MLLSLSFSFLLSLLLQWDMLAQMSFFWSSHRASVRTLANSRNMAGGYSLLFFCIGVLAQVHIAFGSKKVPDPPLAGWCRTQHRPLKPAQSSYKGFCKKCFQKKFPDEYREKLQDRKKKCKICGLFQDLRKSGVCKVCTRVRKCEVCGTLNEERDAKVCDNCPLLSGPLKVAHARLALWCRQCTTATERSEELCHICSKRSIGECHHCGENAHLCEKQYACDDVTCKKKFRLCEACTAAFQGVDCLQCKECWFAQGNLCVRCQRTAQRKQAHYRSCKRCMAAFFCVECGVPPPTSVASCRMCTKLALWCPQHCSEFELSARLCRQHFDECSTSCSCCGSNSKDTMNEEAFGLSWHRCSSTWGCVNEILMCHRCSNVFRKNGYLCNSCWTIGDHFCVVCEKALAQTAKQFLRCCRFCFSEQFSSSQKAMVRKESDAYLASISQQQSWHGDEPALQLLVLPFPTGRCDNTATESVSLTSGAQEFSHV